MSRGEAMCPPKYLCEKPMGFCFHSMVIFTGGKYQEDG